MRSPIVEGRSPYTVLFSQKRDRVTYQDLRTLAKVAEQEGVSREAIRQCLEKMPTESEEYQIFRAIAQEEKGGRPKEYEDFKEHRKLYMRRYRAKA